MQSATARWSNRLEFKNARESICRVFAKYHFHVPSNFCQGVASTTFDLLPYNSDSAAVTDWLRTSDQPGGMDCGCPGSHRGTVIYDHTGSLSGAIPSPAQLVVPVAAAAREEADSVGVSSIQRSK
jgi:hypothetical protein